MYKKEPKKNIEIKMDFLCHENKPKITKIGLKCLKNRNSNTYFVPSLLLNLEQVKSLFY